MKYLVNQKQAELLKEQFNDDFFERLVDRYSTQSISYYEISEKMKEEISKRLNIDKKGIDPQSYIGRLIAEASLKFLDELRTNLRWIDESPIFIDLMSKLED
jgi:hypothetical protein